MPNATNITPPRVPLVDQNTGLVSREWYQFFLTLFRLTGSGQNLASLTDLQVGPPPVDMTPMGGQLDGVPSDSSTAPRVYELLKALEGVQGAPAYPGTSEQVWEAQKAILELQMGPPVIPSTAPPLMTAIATLDFPNTLAQSSSDLTITVPGAVDGDVVTLGVPNACVLSNSCYTGWVSAPDTVTIRFNNYSTVAQNPPSGSFRPVVTRF